MSWSIEIEKLGKRYIIFHEKEAIVRRLVPRLLGIRNREEFWALNDINLKISKGQSLGIIGKNGAGKSTLLNIIAGITFPTQGIVRSKGIISTLLGLGSGFHPELTGEENVYLNASILGMKLKDIKGKFKKIVEFSELGSFIDIPLKAYSSGMYMRLGFSIAINVDFDILLIDEALSVGDNAFQQKCLVKLKEFRKLGKTLIMASHSLNLLEELCDSAVLLEKGKIICHGNAREVLDTYMSAK